jgi:hypothetical protein
VEDRGGDASGPLETRGHAEESDQEGQAERYEPAPGSTGFPGRGTRTALTHMRGAPAGLGRTPADHLFSQ